MSFLTIRTDEVVDPNALARDGSNTMSGDLDFDGNAANNVTKALLDNAGSVTAPTANHLCIEGSGGAAGRTLHVDIASAPSDAQVMAYELSSDKWKPATPAAGGAVAGNTTEIQFNTTGSFDASANFTYTTGTGQLLINGTTTTSPLLIQDSGSKIFEVFDGGNFRHTLQSGTVTLTGTGSSGRTNLVSSGDFQLGSQAGGTFLELETAGLRMSTGKNMEPTTDGNASLGGSATARRWQNGFFTDIVTVSNAQWTTGTGDTVGAVTEDLNTIAVATDTTVTLTAIVAGNQSAGSDAYGYQRIVTVKDVGGTLTLVSQSTPHEAEDDAAADCNWVVSGNDVILRVLGVAAKNIDWESSVHKITQ